MEQWKEYRLGEIATFITAKSDISLFNKRNYISTENILPNRSGIKEASSLPTTGSVIAFCKNDILISNIRPYFKKIWLASFDGGCSNDVICLRAKENVSCQFLYYLLSQDAFFDYVMLGAKGTKMPRGDRNQIIKWVLTLPPLKEQHRIVSLLYSLDSKIELNRKINSNLKEQAKALFKSWFIDFEPFKGGKFVTGKGIDECIARAVSLFKDKGDALKRLKLPKFKHAVIAVVELEPKNGVMRIPLEIRTIHGGVALILILNKTRNSNEQ